MVDRIPNYNEYKTIVCLCYCRRWLSRNLLYGVKPTQTMLGGFIAIMSARPARRLLAGVSTILARKLHILWTMWILQNVAVTSRICSVTLARTSRLGQSFGSRNLAIQRSCRRIWPSSWKHSTVQLTKRRSAWLSLHLALAIMSWAIDVTISTAFGPATWRWCPVTTTSRLPGALPRLWWTVARLPIDMSMKITAPARVLCTTLVRLRASSSQSGHVHVVWFFLLSN